MTHIYLVRHGETDWNAQRRIQGSTDIPLNDTGREQAAITGRLLARRQWDAVVSSPLSRAFETASIIAREVGLPEPTTREALVERAYGEAEGLDWEEVDRRFPGDDPVPGRETREQVTDRVIPSLIELAEEHPGKDIIVVSHGGVIRSVLNEVDPGMEHGPISNGSIHSILHTDGTLELLVFNDPIDVLSLDCATEGIDEQNALEGRDTVHS